MEFVNELANVKPANVIPDFVTTVDEASLYVAEGVERNFADLERRINLAETNYFQRTGRSIVYEGVDLKAIKNAIIDKLKKLWAMIKKAFEFVFNKIKELINKVTSKFQSKDDIAKRLKNADPDRVLGKVHKFLGLEDLLSRSGSYMKDIHLEASHANSYFVQLAAANKKEQKALNKASGTMGLAADNALGKILVGKDSATSVDAIIKKVQGEEIELKVSDVIRKFEVIWKKSVDYGYNVKRAKGLYDDEKKIVSDMQAKVAAAKDIDTSAFTKYLGRISTAITVVTNAATRCLATEHRELVAVLNAARSVKEIKAEGKKAKNESYVNSDLDVLFDF